MKLRIALGLADVAVRATEMLFAFSALWAYGAPAYAACAGAFLWHLVRVVVTQMVYTMAEIDKEEARRKR